MPSALLLACRGQPSPIPLGVNQPVTKAQILTVSTEVEGELRAGQVAKPLAVWQKDVSCPPCLGSTAGCLWAWKERRERASRWLLPGVGWGAMGVAEG